MTFRTHSLRPSHISYTHNVAANRVGRILTVAAAALIIAGCGKHDTGPATPQSLPVTMLEVKPQRVPIAFDVVGQTEGSKQVEVRARVSGILLKRLYNEGDPVLAGKALFQIDRAPFEIALAQAKAQLAQEQARGEQAKREEARLKPLVDERAISRKEYDDATSALKLSDATQQAAAAQVKAAELNLSYTLVTAPVAGVSGRAEHSEGSLITTDANGSLLTTVNQVNPIWVRFSLAQTDLAKLPAGRFTHGAPVDVRIALPDGSKYPLKGRLNFSAAEIDTRLGTQQLRAEFDNPNQQLLPGQFVHVLITAGYRDNVFLVPQAAVMQTEKGYFVFVVGADGKATIRPVTTGEWVGSNWAILSGLATGDRIIVDNLLKVRPGAPVTAAPPPAPAAAPDAAPTAPAK